MQEEELALALRLYVTELAFAARELELDELTPRIAALGEPVAVDGTRVVVIGVLSDRAEKVLLRIGLRRDLGRSRCGRKRSDRLRERDGLAPWKLGDVDWQLDPPCLA